jgi:hypothetical protein
MVTVVVGAILSRKTAVVVAPLVFVSGFLAWSWIPRSQQRQVFVSLRCYRMRRARWLLRSPRYVAPPHHLPPLRPRYSTRAAGLDASRSRREARREHRPRRRSRGSARLGGSEVCRCPWRLRTEGASREIRKLRIAGLYRTVLDQRLRSPVRRRGVRRLRWTAAGVTCVPPPGSSRSVRLEGTCDRVTARLPQNPLRGAFHPGFPCVATLGFPNDALNFGLVGGEPANAAVAGNPITRWHQTPLPVSPSVADEHQALHREGYTPLTSGHPRFRKDSEVFRGAVHQTSY